MSSEVGHHGRISGDGAGVIISSGEVRPGDSHMSLTSRDLYPFVSGDYRITARLRANRQGMTSDGPYGLNFGIWDVNLDNQCQEYIVLRTGSGDGNQLSLLTSRGDRSYDVLDSTEWHTYEFRFESGSLRILIDGGEIDLLDLAGYGFPDKGYRVLASTGGRHYSPADNTVYIDWLAVESGSQTLLRIDDDKGFLWDYEMGNGYIYQEDGRLVMKNIVVKRLGNYDSVSYLLSRATFRPVTGKWRLSARMRANVQGFCNDGPYGLAVGFVDVTRRGDNLFLMPGNGDGTNLSIS